MSFSIASPKMDQVAARRIAELRQLSFDEVAALPERLDESERINGRHVAVAVWRDYLVDGRIRVVVQAYHRRFLGGGAMEADGFIIAADGTRTPVPQEMMWEFT